MSSEPPDVTMDAVSSATPPAADPDTVRSGIVVGHETAIAAPAQIVAPPFTASPNTALIHRNMNDAVILHTAFAPTEDDDASYGDDDAFASRIARTESE